MLGLGNASYEEGSKRILRLTTHRMGTSINCLTGTVFDLKRLTGRERKIYLIENCKWSSFTNPDDWLQSYNHNNYIIIITILFSCTHLVYFL